MYYFTMVSVNTFKFELSSDNILKSSICILRFARCILISCITNMCFTTSQINILQGSKDFSKFQVAKLLKHSKLTTRLDNLRKELNSKTTEISKHLGDSLHNKDVWTKRVVSSDAGHSVLIKGLRDKRKKSGEQKETESFPTISEESSNSDELLQDSGTDERTSMDFLKFDQLTVIGHAIGQSGPCDKAVIGQSRSDDMKTKNRNGKTCNDSIKPVFRPVIEIDTDSDSSDEDTEYDAEPVKRPGKQTLEPICKGKGDNTLVRGELAYYVRNLIPKTVNEDYDNDVIVVDDSDLMDDVQANRDLQLAIEKSLQDQINLVSDNSADFVKETRKTKKQGSKSKSIFDKQISNRSILTDDSNEQIGIDLDKQNGIDNKLLKATTRDIFKKQISNISNFSNESDTPNEDKIMEVHVESNSKGIPLKRRSSELPDEGSESKRKRIGSFDDKHNDVGEKQAVPTISGDDSSESDGNLNELSYEPHLEKSCLWCFRSDQPQTRRLTYMRPEIWL